MQPPGTDMTAQDAMHSPSPHLSTFGHALYYISKAFTTAASKFEKIGYVDTENESETLEPKGGKEAIDLKEFKHVDHILASLHRKDHNLHWWIPDGQLCPTVPNRSNYIHWIEDLLSSDIIPRANSKGDIVRGFDIGTGANCIYPLLGASFLGWNFVASDVTDVALEWAERNV
ncbi:hypothetical protein V6N13_132872 [Hibiscus sabdariffa]